MIVITCGGTRKRRMKTWQLRRNSAVRMLVSSCLKQCSAAAVTVARNFSFSSWSAAKVHCSITKTWEMVVGDPTAWNRWPDAQVVAIPVQRSVLPIPWLRTPSRHLVTCVSSREEGILRPRVSRHYPNRFPCLNSCARSSTMLLALFTTSTRTSRLCLHDSTQRTARRRRCSFPCL